MYRFVPILAVALILLLFTLRLLPPVLQEVVVILLLMGSAFLVARITKGIAPSSLGLVPLLVLAAFAATVWIAITATTVQRLIKPEGADAPERILRGVRHVAMWAYVTLLVVKALRGEYRGYRARQQRRERKKVSG